MQGRGGRRGIARSLAHVRAPVLDRDHTERVRRVAHAMQARIIAPLITPSSPATLGMSSPRFAGLRSSLISVARVLANSQESIAGDAFQSLNSARGPAHLDRLGGAAVAKTEVQPHVIVRVIARLAQHGARVDERPFTLTRDDRADRAAVGRRTFKLQFEPVVRSPCSRSGAARAARSCS